MNKYLEKIAQLVETNDDILPSISGYVGPTMLGTAAGSIVPILGNIVGGVSGYRWAKSNNQEVKDKYEKDLLQSGVDATSAKKLKEVLPVSYLGTTLAGLPSGPLGLAIGAGGTYMVNADRRKAREEVAKRLNAAAEA